MDNTESSTPCNHEEYFHLDFSLPFKDAIKDLKTTRGRAIKVGSDNYHVLADLFNGKVIDDYERPSLNDEGRRVHNIASRVSALRHLYEIKIESRYREGKNYVEYWIDRRVNV